MNKGFVKRNLEESKGFTFMGVDLNDMSRDELIAVAFAGWNSERNLRERTAKDYQLRARRQLRG